MPIARVPKRSIEGERAKVAHEIAHDNNLKALVVYRRADASVASFITFTQHQTPCYGSSLLSAHGIGQLAPERASGSACLSAGSNRPSSAHLDSSPQRLVASL